MSDTNTTTIVCLSCGQAKSVTEFSLDAITKNYNNICKACLISGSVVVDDDSSDMITETSRYQLDSKARIKISQNRIMIFKKKQELNQQLLNKQHHQQIINKMKQAQTESKIARPNKAASTSIASGLQKPKDNPSTESTKAAAAPKSPSTTDSKDLNREVAPFNTAVLSYTTLLGRLRSHLVMGAPINYFMEKYMQSIKTNKGSYNNKSQNNNKATNLTTDFIKNNLCKKP